MNLIETNDQINMTSDHSVSSNNWFKSHVNVKIFNMFLILKQFCKARWYCFSVCCKGDVNSISEENSKETSWSTISTEVSFNSDSN